MVKVEELERAESTQTTPIQRAMAWLRDHWPAGGYRSVLIWRFDVVAMVPMGSAPNRLNYLLNENPVCAKHETTSSEWMRPMKCWCHPLDGCESNQGWAGYVSSAHLAYYRYDDDWGYSFPGWLARCAIPIFDSDCLDGTTHIVSHECNFRLAKTYRTFTTHPEHWVVYRENYKRGFRGGSQVCALLRDNFDGPPCPHSEEEGLRVACRRYAHIAGITSLEEATQGDTFVWNRMGCGALDLGMNFTKIGAWIAHHQAEMTRGYDHDFSGTATGALAIPGDRTRRLP